MTFNYPSSLKKPLLSTALALSIALSGALPIHAAAAPTAASQASLTAPLTQAAKENQLFLQEKYGISFQSAAISKGQFLVAVAAILDLGKPSSSPVFADLNETSPYYSAAAALYEHGILTSSTVQVDQPLTAAASLYIAVKAAELKELASTYSKEKTEAALKKLNLSAKGIPTSAAQELATAVDTGLLPTSLYQEIKGRNASAALSEALLVNILSFKGQYKHYIGYTSDDQIFSKLTDAYHTSNLIQAPELQQVVDSALKQALVTGYNLKDARYDANFVDSLTLTYGHDNLKHAIQLIGLLRSEGLNAKVQLEPKTSAFIYLKEWGEPVETNDYKVVQIDNGNYIAYAKEYDIKFEFNNAADKTRFQPIILQYAKKNSEDQTGLIASSWWQPLYYSLTELKEYEQITNNVIVGSDHYYAQSFSLNKDAAAIVEGFTKLNPSLKIESYKFWVDKPFFNYLNGESL
ncbi:MAG: hypothetical protein ACE3L7_31860 [Candidatus Pristimantibacillus sp.]